MTGYGINIPLTPQTDPRKYPEYKFREFPKMLLQKCDDRYVEVWRQRNSYLDERTGKFSYIGVSPRVGSMVPLLATAEDVELGFATAVNDPVIVNNPEAEAHAKKLHGMTEVVAKPQVAQVQMGPPDEPVASPLAQLVRKPAPKKKAKRPPGWREKQRQQAANVKLKELPSDLKGD
jgi:hypothetical protein